MEFIIQFIVALFATLSFAVIFPLQKGAVLLRFYRSAWLDHLLYNGSV